MTTVAEIQAALSYLDAEQLHRVETEVRAARRRLDKGVIFDDAYGLWTEEDQASVAAAAWEQLDAAPSSAR